MRRLEIQIVHTMKARFDLGRARGSAEWAGQGVSISNTPTSQFRASISLLGLGFW